MDVAPHGLAGNSITPKINAEVVKFNNPAPESPPAAAPESHPISTSPWKEENTVATYHDYESALSIDPRALDNNGPFCGHRYSILNIARIAAVNLMNPALCNQCIEVQGLGPDAGPSVYMLAVDKKGASGLDIAGSSFQALFPSANILDPQRANWRVVDASLCGKICFGTTEECTIGYQNNLPGYLLPAMDVAPHGLANSNFNFEAQSKVIGSSSKVQGSVQSSASVAKISLGLIICVAAYVI